MVSAERHRYIVGLDFGTTFTGISHVNATKKSIDDIQVIKNWPGPSKEFSEVWKTPSKIAYRSENLNARNVKDDAEEVLWGYDVEPGMISYSWMKLRLDEATNITEHDDVSLAGLANSQGEGMLMLPRGKSAVEVCTDYLTGVYNYTMSELKRTWGETIVDATPIDFWLTVPATWSDRAKYLTKTAALSAGFATRAGDYIYLITEPEAAAVATLSGLVGEGVENQLQEGDGILVCDCGGGTVDINTYRIESVSPTLEFEELAVGQGGKVGSTFIDRQFHEWLSSHFGLEFYHLDFKKKGPGSRLMKEFEAIKRDFGCGRNSQKEFRVPLVLKSAGSSKYYDEEENMVIISRDDLESFFKPSIKKIERLLEEQLMKANNEMEGKKTISIVILVGGFGDSQYLFDTLSAWCVEKGDIKLLCPPNPQAAIVKGAALRGLGDIRPSRRRCRRHYGFAICRPFKEGIDPQILSFTERWHNAKFCDSVMKWPINKGDYVTERTKISSHLFESYFYGERKNHTMILYASSEDLPPKYEHDGGFEQVGVLKYDFEDLDLGEFETKIIKGRRAYCVRYEVQVHLGHKSGVLVFKVVSGDNEVGKVNIDFTRLDGRTPGLLDIARG